MNVHCYARHLAGLTCAALALLGASPPGPQTMYLRLPDADAAAPVSQLSYDAVATVPQAPGIPASLLPRDYVEATLILPVTAHGPLSTATNASRFPMWTIVETNSTGAVLRRTTFRHVAISSNTIRNGDGTSNRCVRFTAASVIVTVPANVVAKGG